LIAETVYKFVTRVANKAGKTKIAICASAAYQLLKKELWVIVNRSTEDNINVFSHRTARMREKFKQLSNRDPVARLGRSLKSKNLFLAY